MKSRSKFAIDAKTVVVLFAKAGIDGVTNIAPLGAGEFNAIYAASAGGHDYVIKIAPAEDARTLTYESGMMKEEVGFYALMRDQAHIRVPEVFFEDFTRQTIPADYFIMERLVGETLDRASLSVEERILADRMTAEMVASLHRVKSDKFGYRQNGLHADWFSALSAMVKNLMQDARRCKAGSRNGKKLLSYVRRFETVLRQVDCRLVNFDVWTPNIICRKVDGVMTLAWIDPERCFWGDRIADFVCLDFMNMRLERKTATLQAYNRSTDAPVAATPEERIRFALMLGYLGLIMEVEKYTRYTIFHFGWWRNVAASRLLMTNCFNQLKDYAHAAKAGR
ncbi:MAG: hypothetical protein A2Y16_05860 [Tenericutes bacterium GWF2_57_13]|nr:MAG: hypothetical protein A2Y16_05860 [Tenericutes bacterium GWF2_57_13]